MDWQQWPGLEDLVLFAATRDERNRSASRHRMPFESSPSDGQAARERHRHHGLLSLRCPNQRSSFLVFELLHSRQVD